MEDHLPDGWREALKQSSAKAWHRRGAAVRQGRPYGGCGNILSMIAQLWTCRQGRAGEIKKCQTLFEKALCESN
jgi:hypothetical protein